MTPEQIRVAERVTWWMRDMAFKPPELIEETNAHGLWYHLCMAKDIAQVASGNLDFTWSSQRLDPPASWTQ